MLHAYWASLAVVFLCVTGLFVLARIHDRNDMADIFWGPGFLIASCSAMAVTGRPSLRWLLVTVLVAIWGMRLAFHIGKRHVMYPEDSRYAKWRREWGAWFVPRSYAQVFLLQGILLTIAATPLTAVAAAPKSPLGPADAFGGFLWLFGFCWESISDSQLAAFKNNPANRGKLMTTGLWAWSRHPNYFGEVVLWWGIWFFTLGTPYFWIALAGPLTVTLLILKVSGVPMLEEKFRTHPDYAAYAGTTSVFFPMPPRKDR